MHVWVTIGFTCDASKQKYYLIKEKYGHGLCLACTMQLEPGINVFCLNCNKTLDSFIMESWKTKYDAYIQWIEYSRLTDIQQMTSLRHGCTLTANWLPQTKELTRVTLKKIIDRQNALLFDFDQVNHFTCKIMQVVLNMHY